MQGKDPLEYTYRPGTKQFKKSGRNISAFNVIVRYAVPERPRLALNISNTCRVVGLMTSLRIHR